MRSCSERVVADDRRTRDAVDDLRDHVLLGDAGQAVADDAGVGLDLDEAAGQRGLAVERRQSLMCSGTLSGVAVTRAIFMTIPQTCRCSRRSITSRTLLTVAAKAINNSVTAMIRSTLCRPIAFISR